MELQRFQSAGVDGGFVDVGGVEIGGLARVGARRRAGFGGVLDEGGGAFVAAVGEQREDGDAGAVGGDFGALDPGTIGEVVEVVARLDGGVHPGEVDAVMVRRGGLLGDGGAGDEGEGEEGSKLAGHEAGFLTSVRTGIALGKAYLMSRQLGPRPTSATMGTLNSATCSISCWTRVRSSSASAGRTSKRSSSWTWRVMRERRRRAMMAASMRSMASLMRSAAVPCSGVLMAVRSAKPRMLGLRDWMSGRGRPGPKYVRTAWSRRTVSRVSSMKRRTPA